MSGPTPPPSYNESLRSDMGRKPVYGGTADEGNHHQAGKNIIKLWPF